MKASGQWGGQSKVKRLANDQDWVNFLLKTMVKRGTLYFRQHYSYAINCITIFASFPY